MATTIKNEQRIFTATTLNGNITAVCEVRVNGDNSLAGITQGRINDSEKGDLGSFTADNYSPMSTYPQQALRITLNANNIYDIKICSDSVSLMLEELASTYPIS